MPSVPIERPSLTPIVLKRRPTSPAAWTPSLTCAARRSRCMLHVLPSYHMLQMPTCGFCRSASVRPMPYSIACDAPWLRGWVTREEYLFAANGPTPSYRLDGRRLRELDRVEEWHHVAQLGADDLHRMIAILFAHPLEVRAAGLVLVDPLLRELARLDLLEQLPHGRLGLGRHDARAGSVIAVLRRVADRVPHVLEAAPIHQVDDQLQLVEAFEVGDLRLVARLDERLEAGLDECARAAAQHRLLAEQIRLGLLGKRRLDHAGARAADGASIGERERASLPRHVLVNRQQARRAAPFGEHLADTMPRRLRRDHGHVDVLRRNDPVEAHGEAVREHQHLARRQMLLDVRAVDLRLVLIGN